jgi:hypothetical protein
MSNLLSLCNFSRFWAIGFFAFSAGGIIHVLLVIATGNIITINPGKDYV